MTTSQCTLWSPLSGHCMEPRKGSQTEIPWQQRPCHAPTLWSTVLLRESPGIGLCSQPVLPSCLCRYLPPRASLHRPYSMRLL